MPPNDRQARVNRLKEANEGHCSHLRVVGTDSESPASFGYVVRDDKLRSEVALKLDLAELLRAI